MNPKEDSLSVFTGIGQLVTDNPGRAFAVGLAVLGLIAIATAPGDAIKVTIGGIRVPWYRRLVWWLVDNRPRFEWLSLTRQSSMNSTPVPFWLTWLSREKMRRSPYYPDPEPTKNHKE